MLPPPPPHMPAAPASGFWVAEADVPAQWLSPPLTDDAPASTPANSSARTTRLVVGCVGLQQLSKARGELRRMSVASPWRSRGIARALAEAAVAHARTHGLISLQVTTTSAQPHARALYASLGFKEVKSGFMIEAVPVQWHGSIMRLQAPQQVGG